jgi:hypothetical protein
MDNTNTAIGNMHMATPDFYFGQHESERWGVWAFAGWRTEEDDLGKNHKSIKM